MIVNANKTKTFALLLILGCVLPNLYLPLVLAVEDSWATMEPMPTARSGLGVAVVDSKIYAIGGYKSGYLGINEMYDPATNTSITKKSMPTPRINLGTAVVDNKIYVIGGMTNTRIYNITEVYDPETDTWESRAPFQTMREYPVVNAVHGKIYVMAGVMRKTPLLIPYGVEVTEIYDPATDSWTTGAPMPDFSGEGTSQTLPSAVIDDKIYLIVGSTTRIYDTKTDTWSYGAHFPATVHGGAAGATTGEFAPKRIYVMGGLISGYDDLNNQTYVYDPETDTWTTGAPMLTPRYRLSVAVVDDKLYALGGYDGKKYYNENEVYTPADYIPEFPSWIILPLFLMAMLFAVIIKKRVSHSKQNRNALAFNSS